MALVRKNGQLVQVSDAEASSLSGQSNQLQGTSTLPPPPSSPAGTAAAGGTPDQAKMTGTPNQKQAAVDANIAPTKDEATQTRLNQGKPRQATAGETNESSMADRLQSLGNLQTRVQQQIQGSLGQLGQAKSVADTNAAKSAVTDPTQVGTAQQALQALAANPNDKQAADTWRALTNGADPNKYINSDVSGTLGAAAAAGAENNVQLGSLKDLGMSEQQLAQVLGPNWKQMDLSKLDDAIKTLSAQQFGQSQALAAQLSDKNATANREALAQQASGRAALGLDTKDASVQALSSSLATLDDKTKALLSDDNISKQVMQYLTDPKAYADPKGNPEGAQLLKDHPELFKWADANKDHLGKIADQVTGTTTAVTKQAAANSSAFDLQVGVPPLSDAVKNALGASQGAKKANTAVADVLKNMSVDQASAASSALNDLVAHDASVGKALAGIPQAQLQNLMESGRLASYAQAVRQHSNIDKLGSDPNKLMDFVFGNGMTADQAMQSYGVDQKLAAHGDSDAQSRVDAFQKLLDKDKDGQLDSAADIKGRLKGMQDTGALPSLSDVAKGKDFKQTDWGVSVGDEAGRSATAKTYDALNVVSDNPGEYLNKTLPAELSTIKELTDWADTWSTKFGNGTPPTAKAMEGVMKYKVGDQKAARAFVDDFTNLGNAKTTLQDELDNSTDPAERTKLQSFMTQINQGLDSYKKLKPFFDAEGGEEQFVKNDRLGSTPAKQADTKILGSL